MFITKFKLNSLIKMYLYIYIPCKSVNNKYMLFILKIFVIIHKKYFLNNPSVFFDIILFFLMIALLVLLSYQLYLLLLSLISCI